MRYLFITGTSRGIGRAIAEAAAAQGDFLVHGYARGKGPEHANYRHHRVDLGDTAELALLQFPMLDEGADQIVLVNNAGTLGPLEQTGRLDPDAIDAAVRINLTAPMLLSNAFVKRFRDYPAPKLIIHVTSGAAQSPYDGWSVYCATKAGLDMLTRVQNEEFIRDKRTHPFMVRAVAPGVVETGMQADIRASTVSQFSRKGKFVALHESGALSHPQAVGKAYVDLIRSMADGHAAWPELISRLPDLTT